MKDQWGGGILESRKNPKGLQRFNKNKKQKQILIGSIIGILLVVGGISLYRSFALYKEEKTFDVLNGTVPDFVYKESILNGAYPVLKSSTGAKLIPVTIDENDGTVRKADIKDEWYKYEDKRWANAVILVDGVTEPKNDEIIPEENIESYFVWIPKYKYKIFDMGHYDKLEAEGTELENKAKPIEIKFGLVDTKDNVDEECATPGVSGENGTCDVDMWMTHPAFTAFPDSKGFWVGKFETGYNQNDDESLTTITVDDKWTTTGAEQNIESSSKVIIKPNVYSWRAITLNNMFTTAKGYKVNLDSHMMKNTEWGAVAYLTHSKYGICDDNKCTEIRINNNSNYVTGYAAKKVPTTGYESLTTSKDTNFFGATNPTKDSDFSFNYKNRESNVASTTGNYTGIYDMSGGAWDRQMSTIDQQEIIGEVDSKYYNIYNNHTDITHWSRRILGDATGEMGPFIAGNNNSRYISKWYLDDAHFPYNNSKNDTYNWFLRGGDYSAGVNAGIFSFIGFYDFNDENATFRIVLSPL